MRAGCTDRYVMKTLPPCCCVVVSKKMCLLHVSELEQVNNLKIQKPRRRVFRTQTPYARADAFLSSLQNEAPLFSQDGHKFFFTRAIPQGGRGKFFHISMSTSMVSNCRIIPIIFVLNVWNSVF